MLGERFELPCNVQVHPGSDLEDGAIGSADHDHVHVQFRDENVLGPQLGSVETKRAQFITVGTTC